MRQQCRFIPAGAGNSATKRRFFPACTVYPRWRGELLHSIVIMRIVIGLSPLARGTPARKVGEFPQMRFIPASAGNSSTRAINPADHSVYPRWRGELRYSVRRVGIFNGLSPLARGTLDFLASSMVCSRFIPAGAGNSLNITYY